MVLLVVDTQKLITNPGLYQFELFESRVKALLEKARTNGIEVMNALPEWFSPPEDIVNKSVVHRKYPFVAAYDDGKAVGFAALKIHTYILLTFIILEF